MQTDMGKPEQTYWFPAKRYGWGWGKPTTWQGWVVVACYAAAIAVIYRLYPPDTGVFRFFVLVVIASLVLTAICWLTGEPPRWRWGEERDDGN
jgi:hypothetical protein